MKRYCPLRSLECLEGLKIRMFRNSTGITGSPKIPDKFGFQSEGV